MSSSLNLRLLLQSKHKNISNVNDLKLLKGKVDTKRD